MSGSDVTLRLLLLGEDKTASKAIKGVGDETDKTTGKMGKWGAAGAVMKGALAAGIIEKAATAVLDFGRDSITAASDLQQSMGAVDAVFKGDAASIKASAKSAADDLGLTESAYSTMAATIGAGLKNKGIKDFASETQNLIGIGADLAAQYGGSTQEAVDALASAMRGEMDPIERYGVSLNQAALQGEAMAMGLVKGKKPLTDQEKAMAALSLISKQTADAQGAFGRESDTLAGKQARLDAKYQNLQATLGDALLPAMTTVAEVGGRLVDWISENVDWLGPLATGLGIAAVAMVGLNVAMTANPIGIVVVALGALVGGLIWAYQNLDWFRAGVDVAFSAIGAAGRWLWNNALAPYFRMILDGFAWIVDGLAGMLDALGSVPGFEWAKDAAAGLRGMAQTARDAAGAIRDIPDADPSIRAKDEASAKVAEIDKKIKALKDKTVTAKAKGDGKEVDKLKKQIDKLKAARHEVKIHVTWDLPAPAHVKVDGATYSVKAKGGRYAKGGTVPWDQMALVGEEGPEIVGLPGGAHVFDAARTERMLTGVSAGTTLTASAGATTYVFAPKIDARGALDELAVGKTVEKALMKVYAARSGRPFDFKTRH